MNYPYVSAGTISQQEADQLPVTSVPQQGTVVTSGNSMVPCSEYISVSGQQYPTQVCSPPQQQHSRSNSSDSIHHGNFPSGLIQTNQHSRSNSSDSIHHGNFPSGLIQTNQHSPPASHPPVGSYSQHGSPQVADQYANSPNAYNQLSTRSISSAGGQQMQGHVTVLPEMSQVKNEHSSVQLHMTGHVPPPQMKSLGNPHVGGGGGYRGNHPDVMASAQNGAMHGGRPVYQGFKKPTAPRRKMKETKIKRPMNNYLVCLLFFAI